MMQFNEDQFLTSLCICHTLWPDSLLFLGFSCASPGLRLCLINIVYHIILRLNPRPVCVWSCVTGQLWHCHLIHLQIHQRFVSVHIFVFIYIKKSSFNLTSGGRLFRYWLWSCLKSVNCHLFAAFLVNLLMNSFSSTFSAWIQPLRGFDETLN